MAPDDPMTKPRDTSRRSEAIPAREHPLHRENFDRGPSEANRNPAHPKRSDRAVRQDSGLGDVSPRDETEQ